MGGGKKLVVKRKCGGTVGSEGRGPGEWWGLKCGGKKTGVKKKKNVGNWGLKSWRKKKQEELEGGVLGG